MIRYRFGPEDLGRTRFALSPLWEIVTSAEVLRGPEAHGIHASWARMARPRLEGLDWSLLDEIGRSHRGYVPDFISPPPATPVPDLAGELERIRNAPPGVVARELAWRYEGMEAPAVVRPLLEDTPRGLAALADEMAGYWSRAIAPWWPAIRAALEADIVHRARSLAATGAFEVFADLHPEVRWRDGALEVDHAHEQDVELGGRGLLLVPVAFAWPGAYAMTDPPWQPALIYTPRGIGDLWAPPAASGPDALDALLGPRRATILRALAVPSATTELARRLGASPAGVSRHLTVLRHAGLVHRDRQGRQVRYARTAAGESLLRAGTDPEGALRV